MKKYKSTKDVKVGVLGYGGAFNMGKKHLQEMKKAGMTPFAVCEIDPERLKVAQDDWKGIETYDSLDAMLKQSDVDLVVHITPHNLHYPLAAKCLKAGKHVVTEKPFVITTAEADKLIKLAKDKKLMVSTYHNRHWDGRILRARREIVEKGRIGDVRRILLNAGNYGMPKDWWRTSRATSGGILYDWGVHLLEYALQLLPGAKVVEVSGFKTEGYWAAQMGKKSPYKNDCNEDDALAIVRMDGGQVIELNVSQIRTREEPYMFLAMGTKGCYGDNWDGWTTRIAGRSGKLIEKSGKDPRDRGELFYKNVANYLTGQEKLVITPEFARRPIHIIDLAGRSAAQNKTLKPKYQ